MSVVAIKNQLLTSLNALQTLKAAYPYETANPNGNYPFATLTLDRGEGRFRSTAHNERTRTFNIRIFQEQMKTGQGTANAESIAVSIIDELEQHLDMNTTLSGTCKYAQPISWKAKYEDREHDTRVLDITVEAYEIVNSLR